MIHRRIKKYRLRRFDNRISVDRCINADIGLPYASVSVNRTKKINFASKVSLALFFVFIFSNQISSDVYTASAFSILRRESITSTPRLSSAGPMPSSSSLFLFSLKNDNNGEDKNSNDAKEKGKTATVERNEGLNANDKSEDFAAWMEGLKFGTPLGKMAASSMTKSSDEDDSESVGQIDSTTTSPKTDTSGINIFRNKGKKTNPATSANKDNTGRQKINPLSNLIQFEAMMELTQIARDKDSKDKDGTGIDAKSSGSTSGADVFTAVDRLIKTFQKQEEDQQKKRKELLQFAQLEEETDDKDRLVEDDIINKVDSVGGDINVDKISITTTVKDLMELDRYAGGLPFPKVSNIWDTFSRSDDSVATTDNGISEDDTKINPIERDSLSSFQSSRVAASSSPLFRGKEPIDADITSDSTNLAQAAESILKDTASKMEYLVAEASNGIIQYADDGSSNSTSSSTSALQDFLVRASSVFNNAGISTTSATATTGTIVESISNDIVNAALKIAKESGVDINVQFAADRAREATEFAVGVTSTANMVLDVGYAYGSRSGAAGMSVRDDNFNYLAASAATQTAGSVFSPSGDGLVSEGKTAEAKAHQPPLFGDFVSAQRIEPHEYENVVFQGAEMASLAGAIYEDAAARCNELGHSLVANGTTANVVWMVTDSVMDRERHESVFCHHDDSVSDDDFEDASSGPAMVRTITIRGFDASDESVDREAVLNEICFATAEPMDDATADRVVFHKGLLNIARQIYTDTKKYIDWASPRHKIVLNGHSVGGSLSVLMLLLIASERGADYARDRILRVYSHGSPPVATLANTTIAKSLANKKFHGAQRCPILEAFDLPPSMIYGFMQPYDPVIRLFSNHDVLYPLVDDLGEDGITLYSTGPIRSLRPITRAIFQAWDGWPQFRNYWKGTCNMQYQSVGIQHILLPEPLRYLNDRFISVNVGVPPVNAIVRISPEELLPALDLTFPLDTFQVSLVPQAVRSFQHHFYPAYESSISGFAKKIKDEEKSALAKKSGAFKPFQTKQS